MTGGEEEEREKSLYEMDIGIMFEYIISSPCAAFGNVEKRFENKWAQTRHTCVLVCVCLKKGFCTSFSLPDNILLINLKLLKLFIWCTKSKHTLKLCIIFCRRVWDFIKQYAAAAVPCTIHMWFFSCITLTFPLTISLTLEESKHMHTHTQRSRFAFLCLSILVHLHCIRVLYSHTDLANLLYRSLLLLWLL